MKKKELQDELIKLGVSFKPTDAKPVLERKLKKTQKVPLDGSASTFGAVPELVESPVEPIKSPVQLEESVLAEQSEPAVSEPISVEAEPIEAELGNTEEKYLGLYKIKILKIEKATINGREYNNVFLADGTTVLLNDHDLAAQSSY